jgi:RNA polymerase sigma-70 factor (ECF subfamily)
MSGVEPLDDEERLVARAREGDRRATERLLRAHQPKVYAVCRRLTGSDADALDATQEALIAIVRGLPRFDGRSRLSTWIYRIATNASLDELRRRSRRATPGLDDDLSEMVDHRSADPSTTIADRDEVDAALAQLAPEFRAAVVLRDICTLDYAEISDVLGVPPGTVRSRIARGRAQLADLLDGNQPPTARRPTQAP